jgi:hypothetical protein
MLTHDASLARAVSRFSNRRMLLRTAVRGKAERVGPGVGVVNVSGRVRGGNETEGVGGDVSGGLGVVVAEVVVVQARFGGEVLAREAEWGVGGAVPRPGRRAPESAARPPSDLAPLVHQLARRADQVCDDREEAGVDFVLGCLRRRDAFRLGDGA